MDNRSVIRAVEKKFSSKEDGLEIEEVKGGNHYFYNIYHKGKKIISKFKVSRGTGDYRNPIIKLMSHQLGISVGQFKLLDACTFFGSDFLEHSSKVPK